MPYNSQHHHRHAMRLPGYDYTQAGAYFVTIVTHQRELLFDDPILRRAVETLWQAIPQHFPAVALDENVLMSNHLHGVLWIIGEGRGEAFANGSMSVDVPAVAEMPIDWDSCANASPLPMTTCSSIIPTRYSVIPTGYFIISTRYFAIATRSTIIATGYFVVPISYFIIPTGYFVDPTPYILTPTAVGTAKQACFLAKIGHF